MPICIVILIQFHFSFLTFPIEKLFRVYQDKHGNTVREYLVPEGYTVIDTYTPSVCPWDYYGTKHQIVLQRVLADVCDVALANISTTLCNPVGSGPGGAVRFGDYMTPDTYRLAVPDNMIQRAESAINEHKKAEACKQ